MAIDTIKSTAVLDGAIATADIADANITTAKIADDAVTADKLANSINTSIAVGAAALPKSGGTMTGTIADFRSTGIDDNSNALAMTIDANENVGIGVTPESWKSNYSAVQIGGTGSILSSTTAAAGADTHYGQNTYLNTSGAFAYQVTDQASLMSQNDGNVRFRVAPSGSADAAISWTTAMTIDNTGQLQIGSPSANASNILNLKAASAQSTVRLQSNDSYNAISFLNSAGTENGFIRSNTSSIAYNTSSDYRLKENVTPISDATAQTKLLKPCNFDWIVGGNVNGFLAHELADVVPEAVTGTKDAMRDEEYEVTAATDTEAAVMGTRSVPDMQGIDQSKIVPLLTATIQELITRIEALEA